MSEFIKAIGIFYKNELNVINTYLVNQPPQDHAKSKLTDCGITFASFSGVI